ncbi:MAG TPA: ABC transporter permease [Gemmatimonadaceae bacterium]|nr:ABC transporter permease [Gemmatimonadaceae bacterium]
MSTIGHDLRLALRRLLATPGFTAVAVLILALAIGATTAIFSVVHGVLLRSLPFRDPERLVMVHSPQGADEERGNVSLPDFRDLRARNHVLADMAATHSASPTLGAPDVEPTRLMAAGATPNLFSLLGVEPALGRSFAPDADVRRACEVVLSDGVWRTRLGARADIVGRSIQLEGRPCTVLGVMPATFNYPAGAQLWFPLAFPGEEERGVHNLRVIGRLRPGVTPERAGAELAAIAAELAAEHPQTNARVTARVEPALEALVGRVRTTLLVIFGAVALVLMVACANLASLQLARAAGRTHEMSVRIALGASRAALVRQLLAESVLLGALGGAGGALLAAWAVPALVAAAPPGIPRLEEIGVDGTVLAFALALALATSALFGLVPALHGSRPGALEALRDGARSSAGRTRARTRQGIVVGELALAATLVIGAGLLARSFWRLTRVDPGFEARGLTAVQLQVPQARYASAEAKALFFERVVEGTRRIPGVLDAAVAMSHPLDPGWPSSFAIAGREPPAPGMAPEEAVRPVSPGYFRTVGVPLIAGRDFDARDRAGGAGVAIVNEAFARKYFRGEQPLGRVIDRGVSWWPGMPATFEIVGVAGNERFAGLAADPQPAVYFAYPQFAMDAVYLMVRAPELTPTLQRAIRDVVHGLDRTVPVERFQPMAGVRDAAMATPRFIAAMIGAFAALALLLAAVGIYGVLAQLVAQRRHEIGIRIALGAERWRVMRMVLRQGLALTGAGLALGVAAALGASRTLRALLYGVAPTDAATYVALSTLLAAVALLASWLPARRAARVEPVEAIRNE